MRYTSDDIIRPSSVPHSDPHRMVQGARFAPQTFEINASIVFMTSNYDAWARARQDMDATEKDVHRRSHQSATLPDSIDQFPNHQVLNYHSAFYQYSNEQDLSLQNPTCMSTAIPNSQELNLHNLIPHTCTWDRADHQTPSTLANTSGTPKRPVPCESCKKARRKCKRIQMVPPISCEWCVTHKLECKTIPKEKKNKGKN